MGDETEEGMRIRLGWWLALLVGDLVGITAATVSLSNGGTLSDASIPAMGALVFGLLGMIALLGLAAKARG